MRQGLTERSEIVMESRNSLVLSGRFQFNLLSVFCKKVIRKFSVVLHHPSHGGHSGQSGLN